MSAQEDWYRHKLKKEREKQWFRLFVLIGVIAWFAIYAGDLRDWWYRHQGERIGQQMLAE